MSAAVVFVGVVQLLVLLLLFVMKDAFTIVDELCDYSPPLERDKFFNIIDVDIRYNDKSEKYHLPPFQGSAAEVYVSFSRSRQI